MIDCRRCRVGGRVQGVFYRASTGEQARRLGLTGHARNLPDGTVEVLMCGPETACDELESWLWQGPRMARVDSVECESVALDEPPSGFTTG
ncbi:MAG: acylphosphatase [Pseudomonadota bacterium]